MNQHVYTYLPTEWTTAHLKLWEQFTQTKFWLFTFLVTPMMMLIEKYLFSDWQFLKWLLILMVLDFISGVIAAWIRPDDKVSSLKMRSSVVKTVQYGIFVIVMHVLSHFQIEGVEINFYDWITSGAYVFLIGVEGKSILENVQKMNNKFDISRYINKLKDLIRK